MTEPVWKDITSYDRGERLLGAEPRALATAIKGFPLILRRNQQSEQYEVCLCAFADPVKLQLSATNLEMAKHMALELVAQYFFELYAAFGRVLNQSVDPT